MDHEKVIVIDFGGQYNQLVARRVRECNVYCEIYSYKTDIAKIKAMNPKGIILTGGPNSCYEPGAPTCTEELFNLGVPVLGLCYGAQLMMHVLGGRVEKAPVREYGKTEVYVDTTSPLFKGVGSPAENAAGITCDDHKSDTNATSCWMSHFDYISKVAPGFRIVAHTADCPVAAAQNESKNLYAIQFHPEVLHTLEGTRMLENYVKGVCGCAGDWKMDSFVENTIREIRAKVGDGKVLLALSGGVDSSVAAGLLSRAIGKQLTCVFVDHGLLRKDEGDEVEAVILSLDRQERKMSLGLKQLKADPWEHIEEKYPVGSVHKAKVRNFTNFGIFTELEEGVDGLIHISDLSWTKKVKHPSEFTTIGADIDVVVLEIDKENRRLSLGHKQLEENPWDKYEALYQQGSVHNGKITEMMDKGAVITLDEGGEGFATPKHLTKEDGSQAKLGEELPFKVIEFNKDSHRIILSHSRTFEEGHDEPRQHRHANSGARKQNDAPVINNVQAGTSLGDLDVLAKLRADMEKGK